MIHSEENEGFGRWISVKDRLPDVIGSYIVFFNDEFFRGQQSMGWMFFNSKKEWCMDNRKYKFITHWMPLPKPPKK